MFFLHHFPTIIRHQLQDIVNLFGLKFSSKQQNLDLLNIKLEMDHADCIDVIHPPLIIILTYLFTQFEV